MAVTLPSPIRLPSDTLLAEGGVQTTVTLNATTTKVAFYFQANHSANTVRIWFRTGTVTTSQSLTIGIQRVTTGNPGNPDGSYLASTTQASVATSTLYGVSVATAITRGVNYAVVIEWTSTTGTIQLVAAMSTAAPMPIDYGMSRKLYTSGAWATATMGMGVVGVETDATNWHHPHVIMPISAGTHNSGFNSGSTPDERGNRIYLPAGNVYGIVFASDTDEALDLVLYNDASTAIGSVSWIYTERSINSYFWNVAWFASSIAVSAGWHRAVMKPTTTTNVSYYVNTFDANQMAGLSMGTNCYSTYRTNAGAWTDETNKRHFVNVLMNDFIDGAGGGGSLNPFTSVFGRAA